MEDTKKTLTISVDEYVIDKGNEFVSNTNLGPFCKICGCGPLAPNVFGNTLFCSLCRDISKKN